MSDNLIGDSIYHLVLMHACEIPLPTLWSHSILSPPQYLGKYLASKSLKEL